MKHQHQRYRLEFRAEAIKPMTDQKRTRESYGRGPLQPELAAEGFIVALDAFFV